MGILEGKTVVVTGAGRGLGRAVAINAAQEGANVVVNDLGVGLHDAPDGARASVGPAEDVVSEIRSFGGKAVVDTNSIAEADSAKAIIKTAIDSFGGVHGIVNNAGILRDAIFHKMTAEDFDAVIKVHVAGYFYVSHAAASYFRQAGAGAYVHMTSASGLLGNVGQVNYATAKMAVTGLSLTIALDMARFGVRSNCIAPWAFTRMSGSIPDDSPANAARITKAKNYSAEKVAPLASALLSDRASQVTGQIFGSRKNELYLFSQARPMHIMHREAGWSASELVEHAFPAMEHSFVPTTGLVNYFTWDPV